MKMKTLLLFAASFLTISLPAAAQGHSVSLNGLDAYGTAAGVGGLVTNSTWEAWVRIPANPLPSGVVLQRWGMFSHAISIDAVQGSMGVDMYSCWSNPCGQTVSPPGILTPGSWHHLALVYGPQAAPSCDAYIDGALVAWCGPQQCVPYEGWETVLGAWGYIGYQSFFHGEIDEVRISKVPRYIGPFTPERFFTPDGDTVGLWHFDEGNGTAAYDSSGHGRHFTLHGGYAWAPGLPICSSGETYCTAKSNSLGCMPSIGYTGTPSVASSDFHITASNVLNNKFGLMIWSAAASSAPFGGGTLCVMPPVFRTPHQQSGGTVSGNNCSGHYSFHFSSAYMSLQLIGAGSTIYAQYWSRDPGFPSPNNIGLTNGLKFTTCP
jgi:hypothetical protein